jgi:imidazole glycerol phosphate synthase glutamine amidotransferase subunit
MSVAIVDYGVSNLGSVGRAFRRLGVSFRLTSSPGEIREADLLVLPGVGHFGESMRNLRDRRLEDPIRHALSRGARLLGICVGFQMLFERSEEAPGVEGLALLPGEVKRFPSDLVVPHVGWNQLEDVSERPLLEGIAPFDYFYFLHSYFVVAGDRETVWASTEYGARFCSVGGRGPVAGIQFHPEKSQRLGLQVLSNFVSS